MPASLSRYCIVGLFYADSGDKPDFLSFEGKLVTFDTLEIAQDFLPMMGGGRPCAEDVSRETFSFSPISRRSFNRAVIYTGYDPYDVPGGFRTKGVYSEAHNRDWRWHVYWGHVRLEMMAWANALEAQRVAEEETPALLAGV
ncbi:MAG: hypothetical protein JWN14_2470 [Chthonomonadales bacterium]|nr:hypothetical protein [Chthonomonadales bacterium]